MDLSFTSTIWPTSLSGAEIEQYEVDPPACSIRLVLSLLSPGRVDVLEQAIVDLLEAL